jgi:hypothetical protein
MLSIIAGKPGSGKTYHMSTLLVDMLTDWVRYELKHAEPYDSSVWTNIVFNESGLNETISNRIGKDVDAWKYMNYCDNEFFNDPMKIYWWQKFPPKSVIIIDEVHFHLGKKVEYGSLDLETELINWISTHRHGQQEIYFLSQHTDQFANQVLGIAELLLEIVNLKTLILPFPFNVPMSDLDELKRSLGIRTQYYQANVGNFRGKAVKWSGSAQRHLMGQDIFRVYQSHDTGVEASDRPSLKMTPFEGLMWFARKHAWHLVPKFGVILSLPFVVPYVLLSLPDVLVAGMMSPSAVVKSEVKDESEKVKQGSPVVGESVKPSKPDAGSVSSPQVRSAPVDSKPVERITSTDVPRVASVRAEPKRVKIVMLFKNGVLLDDGRRILVGETFDYEGVKETLACACPSCGVIGFESGRRFKF